VTRVYTYITTQLELLNKKYNTKVPFKKLDEIPENKALNQNKISTNKDYHVVFNSGEEGVWDVCTISERGITSCQRWDDEMQEYNRALIGSILSKGIGVIYLTTGDQLERGERMIKRSIIKIALNIKTAKPMLLIDKMYDAYNDNVMKAFKASLQRRTSLPVMSYKELEDAPLMRMFDPTFNNLSSNERPYEDTALTAHHNPLKINISYIASRAILDAKTKLNKEFKEIRETMTYRIITTMVESAFEDQISAIKRDMPSTISDLNEEKQIAKDEIRAKLNRIENDVTQTINALKKTETLPKELFTGLNKRVSEQFSTSFNEMIDQRV
jgi:hypothetical protein